MCVCVRARQSVKVDGRTVNEARGAQTAATKAAHIIALKRARAHRSTYTDTRASRARRTGVRTRAAHKFGPRTDWCTCVCVCIYLCVFVLCLLALERVRDMVNLFATNEARALA